MPGISARVSPPSADRTGSSRAAKRSYGTGLRRRGEQHLVQTLVAQPAVCDNFTPILALPCEEPITRFFQADPTADNLDAGRASRALMIVAKR